MKNTMHKNFRLVVILAAAALVLSACGAAAEAEPTTDPNMVFTQVAETVMVSMTQTSQAMPPTATPAPTATMVPPTQPVIPTVDMTVATQDPAAAVPTVSFGPTATVQLYGDAAKFNTQSPVDGKVFSKNEDFIYHVCLGNIGETDWTDDYYLKYVDGTKICFKNKTYVGDTVEPNEKWCFDMSCQAPGTSGTYTTYWFFYNDDGKEIAVDGASGIYFTYKVSD